jgi:alkyldihydroxyacetonephosphate synthase
MWSEELKQVIDPATILAADDAIQLHSYDTWPLATKWRKQGKQPYKPDVVVRATDVEQISRLLQWASEKRIPVTPWGAGSSVTGAPLPVKGGIALDLTAMNTIQAIDETNLLVRVQAGIMGNELEKALNERGYTLNHSPQSLSRSTVGGWIATRATGQFSSRWGSIEDLLLGFTVVLPTGEIVELRSRPRAAVGPDLRHVFIGAEGTMGVVTEATLKIFPIAEHRIFQAAAFTTVEAGVQTMREMMRDGLRPFVVRYYDEDESRHAMKDPAFEQCVMFFGVEGKQRIAEAEYQAVVDICADNGGILLGAEPVEAWMARRFDFSTVENLLATTGGYAETIEVAHFWDGILDTYYALKKALAPCGDEVLGHFSHVYPQGSSLYIILLGQVDDDEQAEARILKIWEVAMRICLDRGAAISHHHGVGLARHPYVQADLGSSFLLLERLKAAFDPAGIMNPGKLGLED